MTAPASPRKLFSYRKFWARHFGPAPPPMSRADDGTHGWDSCTTSSSSPATPRRSPGFGAGGDRARAGPGLASSSRSRTGPRPRPSEALGRPNLFFGGRRQHGLMINRYTSDRRIPLGTMPYTPEAERRRAPRPGDTGDTRNAAARPFAVPVVISGIEGEPAAHRVHRPLVRTRSAARILAGRQGRPAGLRQRRARDRRGGAPRRRRPIDAR